MYHFEKDKIYYIIWHDHWSAANPGWQDHEDFLEPIPLQSVGWCTGESDTVVRLVGHTEMKGGYPNRSGDCTILKKAIVKAWELTGIE